MPARQRARRPSQDKLCFARTSAEDLFSAGRTLPPSPVRPGARECLPAPRGHDTLRPVHRRESEQGHARAVPEIPHPARLCRIAADGSGSGYPLHGVLPQQGQEHYWNGQEASDGFWRSGPPHHGGNADAARGGAKDSQRRAGDRLWHPHGGCRGHPRVPHRASAEALQSRDS